MALPVALATAGKLSPYIVKAIAATNAISAFAGAAKRGRKAYNELSRYIPRYQKRQKTSATTAMPRGSSYKRGRSMPPTVRSIKRRRVVKRRRTKSIARYAKRKSKYRSRLRGLVGPQCLPKTAFCAIKYKVCGTYLPTSTASAYETNKVYECYLSAGAGTRPHPWDTVGTPMITAAQSTSSRILDFLGDLFDRYRIKWVKHNLKIRRIAPTKANQMPLIFSIGPGDYDENSGAIAPPAPTTGQQMLMDNQQDSKVFDNIFHNGTDDLPSGQFPQAKRFKAFKKIPNLMGIPPKEYWTEDEYAGTISGDPGSRIWTEPTKKTIIYSTYTKLDQSNLPAAQTESFYFVGTVTLGVYFDAWNQVYRTAST